MNRATFVTRSVYVVLLGLLCGRASTAQVPVEAVKLLADDAAPNVGFGRAVALSNDLMVIGAPGASVAASGGGAAYVYRRIDGQWQEERLLVPTDADPGARFGSTVAIDSRAGSGRVLVGAPFHGTSGNSPGRAYLFDLIGDEWIETAALSPFSAESGAQFGSAVALDRDRAVVSALLEGGTGAVYVYERSDGIWIQRNRFNNGLFGSHSFGESVAIDGEWVLAGDPPEAQVVVFRRMNGSWQRFDQFRPAGGWAVAISGETFISGAVSEVAGRGGEAFVYRFDGVGWVESQRLEASDTEGIQDAFGGAVAMRDGFAVIGAPTAPGAGPAEGAAYVFAENDGVWNEIAKMTPSTGAPVTRAFGVSLGVSRDSIVAGAGFDDEAGISAGAAFAFLRGEVLAGTVNIGDGSPPANVFNLNGQTGGVTRVVDVTAGETTTLGVGRAPSSVRGAYAVWIIDGRITAGAPLLRKRGTRTFKLGTGAACLPITNSVAPGLCPCPSETFPMGRTSKGLGPSAAARYCLNASPGLPPAPTSFEMIFPVGDFLIGGLVEDRNSYHSPDYEVSVGNWIRVESR
jgi:hypothetical protein